MIREWLPTKTPTYRYILEAVEEVVWTFFQKWQLVNNILENDLHPNDAQFHQFLLCNLN